MFAMGLRLRATRAHVSVRWPALWRTVKLTAHALMGARLRLRLEMRTLMLSLPDVLRARAAIRTELRLWTTIAILRVIKTRSIE